MIVEEDFKYVDKPEYFSNIKISKEKYTHEFFPQCSCLASINLLYPPDIPSHLRYVDHYQYREWIFLENPDDNKCDKYNVVDIRLPDLVRIDIRK